MTKSAFPGDQLRARREELGFTYDDLYRKLRISERYVRALESGSFEALPVSCYVRGFILTYCRFLGLQPEPFIESFLASTRPAVRFLGMPSTKKGSPPAWWGDLIAWGTVCAVLILAWLAYVAVLHPEANEAQNRVQAGSIELTIPPTP